MAIRDMHMTMDDIVNFEKKEKVSWLSIINYDKFKEFCLIGLDAYSTDVEFLKFQFGGQWRVKNIFGLVPNEYKNKFLAYYGLTGMGVDMWFDNGSVVLLIKKDFFYVKTCDVLNEYRTLCVDGHPFMDGFFNIENGKLVPSEKFNTEYDSYLKGRLSGYSADSH